MHFFPGTAEYNEPGKEPYRIYVGEETIKAMNATFSGKPVFVGHRDQVNLETLQQDADGYVIESFYLPCDGQTWAKFIVTSDQAHEAIRMGWSLSNSYVIKDRGPGGLNHGVEYQAEVTRGDYDHLAIVKKPRYEQSIILTPNQFQDYVAKKEMELSRVANSSNENEQGESTVLFFKKEKVDNSAVLEQTVVQLPKSKRELTITQLVNEMDEYTLKMPLPKMANDEDYVEMNGKKMNVKELKDCYNTFTAEKEEAEKKKNADEEEMMKKNAEEEAKKKDNDAESEERAAAEEEKKKSMGKDGGEGGKDKAKNEDDAKKKAEDEKKMNNLKFFNDLSEAHLKPIVEPVSAYLSGDRVTRGKIRYGSN